MRAYVRDTLCKHLGYHKNLVLMQVFAVWVCECVSKAVGVCVGCWGEKVAQKETWKSDEVKLNATVLWS